MKKNTSLIILLIFLASIAAQDKPIVFGASGGFYHPIGSLGDRFQSTFGGSVFLGKAVSDNWTWTGKLEYFKFSDPNSDNFIVKRQVEVSGETVPFETKLKDLRIELEVVGLAANANYEIFDTELFRTDFKFGFGIYRWFYPRGGYNDTIKVTSPTNPSASVNIPIVVPAVSQVDWSGGINLGLEFQIKIIEAVSFTMGADYKIIFAEIWPALELGLENISSFQMINGNAGIRIQL